MLTFNNNSETAVIILHEIYGINQHIINAAEEISKHGLDVFVPDMLNIDRIFNYDEMDLAYNNFITNVGFKNASDRIIDFIKNIRNDYTDIYVIGYSVGAATAWICSREQGLCHGIICFYGSRIRDYTEISPSCPVLLFFPEHERSFRVDDLISILNKKENVRAEKLYGEHGFADPFSENYCEKSYLKSYKETISFISEHHLL